MSSNNNLYDPDQAAVNTRWIQPWSEAFRAQRDVGLRVPIDFHTLAAVSLMRACFVDNQYEHNAFTKCFSNLLGVGFSRFEVDVYWDALRSVWSLCPVQLPQDENNVQNNAPVVSGPTVTVSTGSANAKVPESIATPPQNLKVRQESTSVSQSLSAPSSASDSTSDPTPVSASTSTLLSPSADQTSISPSARPSVIRYPTVEGPPILQVGRYNCTSQMTLGLFTGILEDFLDETATTTGATITFLSLNIHNAAPLLNPNATATQLTQDQVPQSGNTLSETMNGNLSSLLYTPADLEDQRADLNSSWYDVEWENFPAQGYYQTSTNAEGNLFTETGWPTEALMEFQQFKRVIASFGTVDEQMAAYDISVDYDDIFPPGTIIKERPATFTSDGQLSSGCFISASDDSVTAQSNSSYAVTTAPTLNIDANPDLLTSIAPVSNLTQCGIIPLLNQSLAGTTADKNPLPYAAYVRSTLWSWAPNQPLNVTRGSETANRCAIMTSSPYPGKWEVADCGTSYRAACQDPQRPYYWEVSSETSNFMSAEDLCHSPLQFAVPHTALENAHLYAALERSSRPNDPLYISLNQISTADCWVIGINGTCPYLQSTDTNRTRIVVVPTVAAVIIFVCAAFTFFIKCASNRREDRRGRSRKMLDGWEYEGVPS